MGIKTYDAKKVAVVVGGFPISGYAKDTFVKVARDEDGFTKYKGSDGTGSRSRNNNRGGTIEITLAGSSASNDVLSALAITDEQNGTGVVPSMVKDLNGTTLHAAAASWVRKFADDTKGKEIADKTWIIDCDDLSMFNGGNISLGS